MTRRVVMMAFAVSFGSAMSVSAQTPLINILKRSSTSTTVSSTLVPVGSPTGTSNTTLTVTPLVDTPKAPPATECGPRPPRPV